MVIIEIVQIYGLHFMQNPLKLVDFFFDNFHKLDLYLIQDQVQDHVWPRQGTSQDWVSGQWAGQAYFHHFGAQNA